MAEQVYTVKDVAAQIAYDKSPAGIAKTIRQVRHWTNCDLLRPLGPKSTGTGVSRVYDANEVRKAAIILELTRYGVTVDMLDTFPGFADRLIKDKYWQAAIDGTKDFFLQLGWSVDGDALWALRPETFTPDLLSFKRQATSRVKLASAIKFNLTTIFQRLRL